MPHPFGEPPDPPGSPRSSPDSPPDVAMEDFLLQIMQQAPYMPYVVVVLILLISGFGVPIPEDIPLLLGGLICGLGHANVWIMTPVSLTAVVGADALLYWVGRRYGHHVTTFFMFRRFLTPQRLNKAETSFHEHGGKTLFIARFLPGVRAATFFSAGVFKIPFWKMLLYDGTAALLSVPLLVIGAYVFTDQFEQVKRWAKGAETTAAILAVLAVVGVVFWQWRRRKRKAAEESRAAQSAAVQSASAKRAVGRAAPNTQA